MEGFGAEGEFKSGETVGQEPVSETNKQGTERLAKILQTTYSKF